MNDNINKNFYDISAQIFLIFNDFSKFHSFEKMAHIEKAWVKMSLNLLLMISFMSIMKVQEMNNHIELCFGAKAMPTNTAALLYPAGLRYVCPFLKLTPISIFSHMCKSYIG